MDREAGFTLLEVLVAFIILSMTLAAVMQIFSGSLRSNATSTEYLTATSRAESRIARTAGESRLQVSERQGTYPDGMSWQTNVRQIGNAGGKTLYGITVRIGFDDNRRAVELQTMRVAR